MGTHATPERNHDSDNKKTNATPQAETAPVQAKMEIGQADDQYEREADAVAQRVVNKTSTSSGDISPISGGGGQPITQRMTSGEEPIMQRMEAGDKPVMQRMTKGEQPINQRMTNGDGPGIQRSADGSMQATPQTTQKINASKGGGSPLQGSTKTEMENGFGRDLSNVRVHTGGNASQLNKEVGAKAFTTGQDIFFKDGAYDPSSKKGKTLLAHEITHTVQQGKGNGVVQRSNDDLSELKLTALEHLRHFQAVSTQAMVVEENLLNTNLSLFLQHTSSAPLTSGKGAIESMISKFGSEWYDEHMDIKDLSKKALTEELGNLGHKVPFLRSLWSLSDYATRPGASASIAGARLSRSPMVALGITKGFLTGFIAGLVVDLVISVAFSDLFREKGLSDEAYRQRQHAQSIQLSQSSKLVTNVDSKIDEIVAVCDEMGKEISGQNSEELLIEFNSSIQTEIKYLEAMKSDAIKKTAADKFDLTLYYQLLAEWVYENTGGGASFPNKESDRGQWETNVKTLNKVKDIEDKDEFTIWNEKTVFVYQMAKEMAKLGVSKDYVDQYKIYSINKVRCNGTEEFKVGDTAVYDFSSTSYEDVRKQGKNDSTSVYNGKVLPYMTGGNQIKRYNSSVSQYKTLSDGQILTQFRFAKTLTPSLFDDFEMLEKRVDTTLSYFDLYDSAYFGLSKLGATAGSLKDGKFHKLVLWPKLKISKGSVIVTRMNYKLYFAKDEEPLTFSEDLS